ncbi:MAG: hypothetical protein HFH25_12980 [Lachnospiraceae bacterium]|nr:hypothetical protein [Lachnospiraceae bacterium]
MKLKRVTKEVAQDIMKDKQRKIYLVDFSKAYLEELLEKYDLSAHLAGILLDTENRMWAELQKDEQKIAFRGMELPVYSYASICQLPQNVSFIILNDYFQETYDKLAGWRREEAELSNIYYFANQETEIDLYYRKKYECVPLENIIVFRSGPHTSSYVRGMDYADNARALFEYMLKNSYNQKYELVWLVKNPSEFSYITEKYENVLFLSFDWSVSEKEEERDAYYHALCLAKYIFMTDAYGFARNARKDQVRVQLWHGCGLKTRINFVRCEHRYEYNIVISEVYKKIHQNIYGLREDQVLVTGYPKDDQLFHPAADWKKELSIPDAEAYIFWLPTFRASLRQLAELNEKTPEGQTGLPMIQSIGELQELNEFLHKKNTVLIIKLHPFQNTERICFDKMTNIVLLTNEMLVERNLQINQILGKADGLISDYSSVAIDFLLLDKPLAFTLDDVEEYERSRGFVFHPICDWLPGNMIYSAFEFVQFIEDTISGRDRAREKRKALTVKLHQFYDDQSSRRVIEALGI